MSRPARGRRISGVWAGWADLSGARVSALRAGSAALTLVGMMLVVAFGIFDVALFGEPAAAAVRGAAIAAGFLAALHYPLLALALPGERTHWDFGSSAGTVIVSLLIGQAAGTLSVRYWDVAKAAFLQRGAMAWLTWPGDFQRQVGFGWRDGIFACFLFSALVFLWLQRAAVKRFFRAMHTGVVLVVGTTLAVLVGVLIPQIDGFEDIDRRVDLEREYADFQLFKEVGYQKLPAQLLDGHEQYQAFRWAEGYFLYHLMHLYGYGMPEAIIPPQAEQGLAAFGRKYGREESDNRRKQMVAAFAGREKVNEIGAFIHRNEDTFWRFFEASTVLHLNRTYKSHWFACLLTLLGTAIFFNTIKAGFASLFKIQKLGFFFVHVGMMVLLLGGLVSKLFTDRGLLELHLGEAPRDTYYRHYNPRKLARMPFSVRLDEFARSDWKALEVHFLDETFSSRVPRYTLWPGREIDLDYVEADGGGLRPRLRLRTKALHDRVRVGQPRVSETRADEEGYGIPLAEILVHDGHLRPDHERDPEANDPSERRTFLFPIDRATEPYLDPEGGFRLAGVYGHDPAEHFPVDEGVLGFIEVTIVGEEQANPEVVEVRLGDTVEVAGGYRIRFADACADFGPGRGDQNGSRHPLPLSEQTYRFAALWVDVLPPAGGESERRLVLEAVDDVKHGRQGRHLYRDVIVRMRWDTWSAPGPPRYLLHWGEGVEPTLINQDGERAEVVLGESLGLPGENRVVVRQVLNNANFESNLDFLERAGGDDGWDADFYSTTPSGLELVVVREPGTEHVVEKEITLASTDFGQADRWFSEDGRLALVFLENSEMLPFEWRSVLSILKPDDSGQLREVPLGSEGQREIRVNDYFKYEGYRFFQTDARADDPTYSGVGVVFDPGIPIVLTGMYTIIAGTVIAFLIRPIVLARRRQVKVRVAE